MSKRVRVKDSATAALGRGSFFTGKMETWFQDWRGVFGSGDDVTDTVSLDVETKEALTGGFTPRTIISDGRGSEMTIGTATNVPPLDLADDKARRQIIGLGLTLGSGEKRIIIGIEAEGGQVSADTDAQTFVIDTVLMPTQDALENFEKQHGGSLTAALRLPEGDKIREAALGWAGNTMVRRMFLTGRQLQAAWKIYAGTRMAAGQKVPLPFKTMTGKAGNTVTGTTGGWTPPTAAPKFSVKDKRFVGPEGPITPAVPDGLMPKEGKPWWDRYLDERDTSSADSTVKARGGSGDGGNTTGGDDSKSR